MNMVVSKANLKEITADEIAENSDIYCSEISANDIIEMLGNITSVNHLYLICDALSSIFHCSIIQVKSNSPSNVFQGRFASSPEEYYGFEDDGDACRLYHVSFPKETVDKYKNILKFLTNKLRYDELGRLQFDNHTSVRHS